MPFALNNKVTADNQAGDSDIGLGNVLLQAVFARHTSATEGFGIGTQFILPTAREEGFGQGKWRLRPTVGCRWSIPSMSKETFFQTVVRYDFRFAGDPAALMSASCNSHPISRSPYRAKPMSRAFPAPISVHPRRAVHPAQHGGRQTMGIAGHVARRRRRAVHGEHRPYDWKLDARIGIRF